MRVPVSIVFAAVLGIAARPQAVAAQEMMDNALYHYSHLSVDAADSPGPTVGRWSADGWIGTDFDRLWWNTEGERADGLFDEVRVSALYGHYVRTFWDLVIGYRQDVEPVTQGYLAFGIQGLAPYWFEVSLMGFVSDRGRPSIGFDAATDLYVTQRLVLQPFGEVDLLLTEDEEWDVGAGARSYEVGARVRYELRRKFAPYLDVTWVGEKESRSGLRPDPGTDGVRFGAGLRLIY